MGSPHRSNPNFKIEPTFSPCTNNEQTSSDSRHAQTAQPFRMKFNEMIKKMGAEASGMYTNICRLTTQFFNKALSLSLYLEPLAAATLHAKPRRMT